MLRKKQYSQDEVVALLYASEGRASPVSGMPGHTLSYHVNIASVNDRLVNRVQSLAPGDSRRLPIIMAPDSGGKMASAALHREIWKELNPGMTSKEAKQTFKTRIDNHKKAAGAFWDLPQAAKVGAILLNSAQGQEALAALDSGSEQRVDIECALPTGPEHVWKMRYGQHGEPSAEPVGTAGWDKLYNFSRAFMLVDKIGMESIHIQTLFPLL